MSCLWVFCLSGFQNSAQSVMISSLGQYLIGDYPVEIPKFTDDTHGRLVFFHVWLLAQKVFDSFFHLKAIKDFKIDGNCSKKNL